MTKLNKELLEKLKSIQENNAQVFKNPKQFAAMLKDLTMNEREHSAMVRWLEIALSELDALSRLEADFKSNQDFSRHILVNNLINEGASEDVATKVIGYWAVLAGFEQESPQSDTRELPEVDKVQKFHDIEKLHVAE